MPNTSVVLANWKMYGSKPILHSLYKRLVRANCKAEVVLLLPAPYLGLWEALKSAWGEPAWLKLGSQVVYPGGDAAATGRFNARMLAEVGCSYALLGHSERRLHDQENDDYVALCLQSLFDAKVTPVVCVGETQVERQKGLTQTVLDAQLRSVFEYQGFLNAESRAIIIAYEPRWCIGKQFPGTENLDEPLGFLRQAAAKLGAKARLVYGGGVDYKSMLQLQNVKGLSGVLVGRVSVREQDFLETVQSCNFL